MSFITDHLLTATGRIGRMAFGLCALGLWGLWMVAGWWLTPLDAGWPMTVISLVLLYPGLCLVNQRLHDIGYAGWWAGLLLVVLVVVGRLQDRIGQILHIGLVPAALLLVIAGLGLMAGQKGHNRYGPSPSVNRPAPEARQMSPDQRPSGKTT